MPSLTPKPKTDASPDPQTQLLRAVERNDATAIASLIRKGANPNLALERALPCSLLWLAIHRGKKASALALIHAGANPNGSVDFPGEVETETPLWEILDAMKTQEFSSVIDALIAKGADLNSVNSDGDPLLHGAIDYGERAFFSALLNAGANMEGPDGWGGRSALIRAIDAHRVDYAQALIQRGARLEALDQDGRSVLAAAMERADPDQGGSLDSPFPELIRSAMERLELENEIGAAEIGSGSKRV